MWPHEGIGRVTISVPMNGITFILPSEKLIEKKLHQIELSTGVIPNIVYRQYLNEKGTQMHRWLEMELLQPRVSNKTETDRSRQARKL